MTSLGKENVVLTSTGPSTSYSTTSTASTELVAGKKKFNASRIRRRMMEQQQRFAASKGVTNTRKPLATQDANHSPAKPTMMTKNKQPALAIAVSMSEDAGETGDQYGNTLPGMSPNGTDDNTDAGNVSAWAMIEHYGHTGFDNNMIQRAMDKQQQEDEVTALWNDADRPADSSTVFHTADGDYDYDDSTDNALSTTATEGIFVSPRGDNDKQQATAPSPRIEWYADANGELIQHSICTDSSFNAHYDARSTTALSDDPNRDTSQFSEEDGASRTLWDTEGEDEKKQENDDDSSPPTSLLQESAVLSDLNQSTIEGVSTVLEQVPEHSLEESYDGTYSVDASYGSRPENETQISIASFEQSEAGALSRRDEETGLASPSKAGKRESPRDVDKESLAAHARIEELEQNLKQQQFQADTNESKLKGRVKELEQALRTSVTTPRGSIMQENPLKALLDRNQTLVKEVRFADQTCIELSSKMSAVEANNQILADQSVELRQENERLTKELEETKNAHVEALEEKQRIIDDLMAKMEISHHMAGTVLNAATQAPSEMRPALDDANARVKEMEATLEQQTNEYAEKIQTLEEQLRQASDHMYLYQDGPTSPRLKHADRRVFELEKELAHSRASIEALRQQIQKSVSSGGQVSEETLTMDDTKDLVLLVQRSMSTILSRQRQMEKQVNEMIDIYSAKLENLTAAVACLRSSLIFETDSVSTQVREERSPRMSDGVTDRSDYSQAEDELLELMEEARSPVFSKHLDVEDGSADDGGDLSRLFADDVTLESATKLESIHSSFTFPDRYKEPLESAIKECKRVKDIAVGLKKELESRKLEIEKLEIENGRLSLQGSRQSEEKKQVESALEQARARIEEIESKLDACENEKTDVQKDLDELEEIAETLRKENGTVTGDLQTTKQKVAELEEQIGNLNTKLESTKEKLDQATDKCEELESQHKKLLAEYDSLEKQITDEKKGEIQAAQEALKEAQQEVQALNESKEGIINRLTAEYNAKTECEAMIAQLQATQQQILSDAEDRLLEERLQQEDSRLEKADLKSKLARKEKEFASLQESFMGYQKRAEHEVQRRDSSLRTLKAELSGFVSYTKKLAAVRADFCKLVESCGLTADWKQFLSSSSADGETSSLVGEIASWVEAMPHIGSCIQKLVASSENEVQLELKVDLLNENVMRLHEAEEDYKQQLQVQSEKNDSLLSLLHQAEQEMERSAEQIREMTGALSRLQEQEAKALDRAASLQNELDETQTNHANELGEIKNERDEALEKVSDISSMMQDKEARLLDLENHLNVARTQIANSAEMLQSRTDESNMLQSKITSLEVKCSRLRELIKKLTTKCDEWEASYEKQGRAMEKIQARDARTREKAADMANRYNKLVGNLKRRTQHHKQDRAKWTNERTHLHQVHTRLEEELETIARELATIDPSATC